MLIAGGEVPGGSTPCAFRAGNWALVFLVLAGGCGSKPVIEGAVPVFAVSGRVTFEGQPLARAVVTLTPENLAPGEKWEAPASGGVTDDEGEFELSTYGVGDGRPEGTYAITVSCEDRARDRSGGEYPELLPETYQNPATSGLKATIRDGENDFLELELFK